MADIKQVNDWPARADGEIPIAEPSRPELGNESGRSPQPSVGDGGSVSKGIGPELKL